MQNAKPKTAYISCCVRDRLWPPVAEAVNQIGIDKGDEYYFSVMWNDSLIERARSRAATRFLESPYEILIFVDDDIYFQADHIYAIVADIKQGRDIVCGVYPTKPDPHLSSMIQPGSQALIPSKDIVKLKYGATGFMAIHRRVLEKMASTMNRLNTHSPLMNYYPFFMPKISKDGNIELSEDWAFTEAATALGFSAWLDTSINVGHIGTFVYMIQHKAMPKLPPTTQVFINRLSDTKEATSCIARDIATGKTYELGEISLKEIKL